jgi:hypothetical protein
MLNRSKRSVPEIVLARQLSRKSIESELVT